MATYRKANTFFETDAAYIAGLIDGEGTITLGRKHRSDNRQLIVSISSTERNDNRCRRERLALDRSVYYTAAMISESDSRQRIVTSARDLIYSRSYSDVGVAEICERAHVKKGSFYHFFNSKHELSLAVIDDLRVLMEDRILIPAFARDLPPLQRLQRFVETLYEFQCGASVSSGRLLGCPFGNLALEMATSDEDIRRKLEGVFASIQARFEHVLEEASAAGDIDSTVDIPATARAMLAYFEGVLVMAKTANDPEVIRTLAPAFAGIRIPRVTS